MIIELGLKPDILKLPDEQDLHPTLYMSLLKGWKSSEFTVREQIPEELIFNMDEYDLLWGMDRLLRWSLRRNAT